MPPVEFRNITRYVTDVEASVPLYQAVGFDKVVRQAEGMAMLQNAQGIALVLHARDTHEGQLPGIGDTAIGLTVTGSLDEARRHLEDAGFKLLREPAAQDVAFFYIYGDLDGNPVTLVARRPGGR